MGATSFEGASVSKSGAAFPTPLFCYMQRLRRSSHSWRKDRKWIIHVKLGLGELANDLSESTSTSNT
jgi:hypothetical protein